MFTVVVAVGVQTVNIWRMCLDMCSAESLELRRSLPLCCACMMRPRMWTFILSTVCWMHSSDSSLALLCTPTLPPQPSISHHRGQGFCGLCVCLCICVKQCAKKREKELKRVWGEAVYLLSPWCCQVCGVKEVRQYVPYLTLLQTGADISFHPRHNCEGCECVCVPSEV